MKDFWLCFVPLFVAVDAIGVLPMFVSLTDGMDDSRRKIVVFQSVITALIVAVSFIWIGPFLLRSLGISVSDFMIAGGIILLVFSLGDLLTGEKKRKETDLDSLGAVPIGIPLITGPGVLTTCLLLADLHGKLLTASAVVLNILLAGLIFNAAGPITKAIGKTGAKTISKLASLLLSSIAIMLIRKGIANFIVSMAK